MSLLVDTSAAIPYAVGDHEAHDDVYRALRAEALGLAGHAAFETYSVLTRLPPPSRRPAAVAMRLLEATFPETRHLSAKAAASLHRRLAAQGIVGGAVYDALIAAVAVEQQLPLVTRDRRAAATYRTVGAEVRLLA